MISNLDKLEGMIKSFPPSMMPLIGEAMLSLLNKTKEEIENDYVLKKYSITWSTEDFKQRAIYWYNKNWEDIYDSEKFEKACTDMIANHNSEHGITWDHVDWYLNEQCKRNG